ncbi:MAG: adenylate/guanylate cyclase domain-containing protein [Dehalococcoidia bacterium]
MTGPDDASPPGEGRAAAPQWILAEEAAVGLPLGKVCAFCGETAPPDSAFCPNDGRALTAALLPASGTQLTVLFTDIEDSVKLTERLGDQAWAEIVDDHNVIVRAAVALYAGFEVKVTGDGFLVVFTDPVPALHCGVEIQRRISARAASHPDWPVQLRIGLHRGDVILRPGGDVLGRTVNLAQRIMGKSSGGEIWVSGAVYEEAGPAYAEGQWLDHGLRRLRGLAGREHLYELAWARDGGAVKGGGEDRGAGAEANGAEPVREAG